MGKVFGWQERNIGIVSFPLECPRCGKETMHTFSKRGRDPVLFFVTVPAGRLVPYVLCTECGLLRRVPKSDRRKIRRLAKYDPKAYLSKRDVGGHVDTSLGRACADPDRMRRYMPRLGTRRAALVLLLVVLLGCPAVGHNTIQIFVETGADLLVDNGVEYEEAGKLRHALTRFSIARGLYWFTGNPVQEAESLCGIGYLRLELEDHRGALRAYQASLDLWLDINDREMLAECYSWIGHIKSLLVDYAGALEAYEASLPHWRETMHWEEAAFVHERMGEIHETLAEFQAALADYERALELYEKLGEDQAAGRLREWISHVRKMVPGHGASEEASRWQFAMGVL